MDSLSSVQNIFLIDLGNCPEGQEGISSFQIYPACYFAKSIQVKIFLHYEKYPRFFDDFKQPDLQCVCVTQKSTLSDRRPPPWYSGWVLSERSTPMERLAPLCNISVFGILSEFVSPSVLLLIGLSTKLHLCCLQIGTEGTEFWRCSFFERMFNIYREAE